jgi:predicted RNA-binding Zn-ribbon protein involved in translation (DUF1610 family)
MRTREERQKPKHQHCGSCNRYVQISTRYPKYACKKCVDKAVDKKGRRVAFYNITMDGHGCQGKLIDTEKFVRSNICYINGIKFRAEEAYFGGIILLAF